MKALFAMPQLFQRQSASTLADIPASMPIMGGSGESRVGVFEDFGGIKGIKKSNSATRIHEDDDYSDFDQTAYRRHFEPHRSVGFNITSGGPSVTVSSTSSIGARAASFDEGEPMDTHCMLLLNTGRPSVSHAKLQGMFQLPANAIMVKDTLIPS